MSEHPFGSRAIAQVGIIVDDIEKYVDNYSRIFGVDKPPVIITDDYELSHAAYKGAPTHATAKLAFFDMGSVQIELIEPIGEPSTWKNHLDQNGSSVHHIAFWVADTDAVVRHLGSEGMTVEQRGDFTGGMYTYIDSRPQLGVTLELLQHIGQAPSA